MIISEVSAFSSKKVNYGSMELDIVRTVDNCSVYGEVKMMSDYASSSDGKYYEYRLVCSHLERRERASKVWLFVEGVDFMRMTPAELRHVADVLADQPNSIGEDDE